MSHEKKDVDARRPRPLPTQELAAFVSSNQPIQKTLRGIEVTKDPPEFYLPDPQSWPLDVEGRPVPQLSWGGLRQPLDRANLHFLISGVPGTGKTLTIRLLLESTLGATASKHLPGSDRALLYDPKQEFYPLLLGMGVPEHRIRILNPFDRRGAPWNLAEDFTNAAEAYQLARTLIPVPESHNQPFFPKSAAALFAAIVSVFQRRQPGAWDLADVLRVCCSIELIERHFEEDGSNPYVVMSANFLADKTTRNNVLAELSTHVFELLPIAACWRHARNRGAEPFSIRRFRATTGQVALLGANQSYEHALSAINRLLLRRLSEIVLDDPSDGQWRAMDRTWLILDELRELGKIEGLANLINKGRSRGMCCVLGIQDFEGMKKAFGEHAAHEITATCNHKLFLRLGAESAQWASKAIGKGEIRETNFSRSTSTNVGASEGRSQGSHWSTGGGSSATGGSSSWSHGGSDSLSRSNTAGFSSGVTTSTTTREADAVLPSEIAHLPTFDEAGGLTGFACQSSGSGEVASVRKFRIPSDCFFASTPTSDPGFVAHDSETQDLFRVLLDEDGAS